MNEQQYQNPMVRGGSAPASPTQNTSPDMLQQIAATNQSIAQANELRHRQILGQEQILQWLQQQLDTRALTLQQQEVQLAVREQEVTKNRQAAEATVAEARSQKEAALADRKTADESRKEAQKDRAEAQTLREQAGTDRAAAEAAKEETEKKLRQADASFMWPKCLETESWRTWRLGLASQGGADWRPALLLSRLQVLASLLRAPENGKPALVEALSAVGMAACQVDPQKAAELATTLSEGLQGKFELSLPRINDNVDRVWMKGPPSVTRVTRVVGWCVKDSQGTVQIPAQVE